MQEIRGQTECFPAFEKLTNTRLGWNLSLSCSPFRSSFRLQSLDSFPTATPPRPQLWESLPKDTFYFASPFILLVSFLTHSYFPAYKGDWAQSLPSRGLEGFA